MDCFAGAEPGVASVIALHERAIRAELIRQAAAALADLRRRPRRSRRSENSARAREVSPITEGPDPE